MPPIVPDLSEAYAKLERSRYHISDLEARITAYLATDFYRLTIKPNERNGLMEVTFDSLHQPDKQINALIGDAVSNLRSTLDYIVVALVAPITGKPEACGFPFANDEKGFIGEVGSKRAFGHADAAVRQFILDEVQAYKGGKGEALWVLNNLRNKDKHRLLVATASVAGVVLSFCDANGNTYRNMGCGIEAGQNSLLIRAPMNHIQFTDKPKLTFEILFEEPALIEHKPVAVFLNSVARNAQRILDAIQVGLGD